jgi:hypothetical protein
MSCDDTSIPCDDWNKNKYCFKKNTPRDNTSIPHEDTFNRIEHAICNWIFALKKYGEIYLAFPFQNVMFANKIFPIYSMFWNKATIFF